MPTSSLQTCAQTGDRDTVQRGVDDHGDARSAGPPDLVDRSPSESGDAEVEVVVVADSDESDAGGDAELVSLARATTSTVRKLSGMIVCHASVKLY